MKIQISLRLRLTKQKKTIKVSYHTFETATYDRYLAASLALRAKSAKEAKQYIDDITGQGSLNAHFASLYEEMVKLTDSDLRSILRNSQVPILKIDASNWYDYYPELDVSIFKRHAYKGDLGEYPNVIEIIQIQEEIVDKTIELNKTFDRPETYLVELTDNAITATFFDDKVTIPPDVFAERLVAEIKDLQGYQGAVRDEAEGNGWFVLTPTKLNNLAMTSTCFYDDAGNHCCIRNMDIRKTVIALINGLYIYKETIVPYEKNPDLCAKVLDVIANNSIVRSSSVGTILLLLRNVDVKKAQKFINENFGKTYFPKEIADFVMRMIQFGNTSKWHKAILQELLHKCDGSFYPMLYRIDSSLSFTIEQLITLDSALLTEEDNKKVEEYWNDVKEMQESIRQIVGAVTTSGLRERSKVLKADNDTRRFTKLCNDLIGHFKKDLTKEDKAETEKWLKAALELKELATKIEDKIKKQEAEQKKQGPKE